MSSAVQGRLFDMDDVISPLRKRILAVAVEHLASEDDANTRGAVYTRREVVDFILDLVGYRPELPLFRYCILEPSFGAGDFLTQIVARLLSSFTRHGSGNDDFQSLRHAIHAVELHTTSFDATRARIVNQLILAGITPVEAVDLVGHWLVLGDFLLTPLEGQFDFVVGNPPYVRQERIPKMLLAEYRSRYRTIYDRADLYVPFIERSLSLLGADGTASFICSDRWMKNRYGSPLRAFVADKYQLQCYIDMVDTEAFHADVTAYPAITVFRRGRARVTRIARKPHIDVAALSTLAHDLVANPLPPESPVVEAENVVNGGEPWLLDALSITEILRRLEKQYPTLEEADCKVGIGVATGADQAFIGEWDALDVEDDRKLPLATTDDIRSGEVDWRGRGVINPFAEDGRLVELHRYPRLARYLEKRRDIISRRHCAKKTPANWYRTIDRIWDGLAATPKLLIPDIKGVAHVVYEKGRLYPHHNLYYIISSTWDLRALQAVLLSRLSQAVVATYSTKMRGGYLRFQAQYLRRIRLPLWPDVAPNVRSRLVDAAEKRDIDACDDTTFDLYGLTPKERATLSGAGV